MRVQARVLALVVFVLLLAGCNQVDTSKWQNAVTEVQVEMRELSKDSSLLENQPWKVKTIASLAQAENESRNLARLHPDKKEAMLKWAEAFRKTNEGIINSDMATLIEASYLMEEASKAMK